MKKERQTRRSMFVSAWNLFRARQSHDRPSHKTLARLNLAYSSATRREGAADIDFLDQANACHPLPLSSIIS